MLKKNDVRLGTTYIVKISGTLTKIKLTRECRYGGWYGTNLNNGRENHIPTAARLLAEVPTPGEGRLEQISNLRSYGMSFETARQIVDKTEF